MSTIDVPEREVKQWRNKLCRLAGGCPVDCSNPECCPLHNLRKEEPEDVVEFVNTLPVAVVRFLLVYHNACLRTRVQDELGIAI